MIDNRNSRGIFFVNATAGLLDKFNRNVYIEQIEDGQPKVYEVPFHHHFGADEGFMRDFFMNVDHGCKLADKAEGDYNVRPLGIVKYNGFSVRTGDMTNKYVRGTMVKESMNANLEKSLMAYSAYLMRLPITIKYSVDIKCDNYGQGFRISEAVLEALYKSTTIYFQYGGMRIPGDVMLSDSNDLDKKTSFTYEDDNKASIKFDVELHTIYPIFDRDKLSYKASIIKEFRMTLNSELHTVDPTTYIEGLIAKKEPIYNSYNPRF